MVASTLPSRSSLCVRSLPMSHYAAATIGAVNPMRTPGGGYNEENGFYLSALLCCLLKQADGWIHATLNIIRPDCPHQKNNSIGHLFQHLKQPTLHFSDERPRKDNGEGLVCTALTSETNTNSQYQLCFPYPSHFSSPFCHSGRKTCCIWQTSYDILIKGSFVDVCVYSSGWD